MEKVRILINKTVVEKIKELPKAERLSIFHQLDIINKSSNPILYSYTTVSSKIGDLLFIINGHLLNAKVYGTQIRIFSISN